MAQHTKGDRRADIRALADTYKIPIKLSEGEIDQCADIGKYEVFAQKFEEYNHLFRVTNLTFSDGSAWPANFFGLAGRQYIAGSPNVRVRFITPGMIPMLTRNTRIAGTAQQPVVYMSDQKFYFLPHSTAGATIEVFLFPRPLADSNIADDQVDTMPEVVEPLIARAGFEVMLKMMLDQQTAFQLNQEEIKNMETSIATLYQEKFRSLNQESQLAD